MESASLVAPVFSSEQQSIRNNILIVEDEPAHAELLSRSFEGLPEFSLTLAETVADALKLLRISTPAMVITDYMLPDGAGKDIIASVEGRCPVIVMTSHGSEQIAVDLMKAGAMDYIVSSHPETSTI